MRGHITIRLGLAVLAVAVAAALAHLLWPLPAWVTVLSILLPVLVSVAILWHRQRTYERRIRRWQGMLGDDSGETRIDDAISHLLEQQRQALKYRQQNEEQLKRNQLKLEEIILKRTKDLAEARDKALRASQAKSRFLATMSHELRTPMNAVLGMLELLEKSDLSLEQREYTEVAASSGVSLLAIINDVLDFSKIEAGRFLLDTVDLDLRVLVDGVTKALAPLAHAKGIEITAFIPNEFPIAMRGDSNRLRQIFTNLLGNAIKFTPEGGTVELHGGVTGRAQGQVEFLFEVRDTGVGIPEGMRDRIFDDFTQVYEGTSRQYPGAGLGLSICKRLVEMMGGEMGVEENPFAPSGSVFFFTVTLQEQAALRPSPDLIMFSGVRVMVAGSIGTQLALLQNCLNAWGARYGHVVDDNAMAAELLKGKEENRPYHLVIYNHQPGTESEHALALLGSLHPPLPVILLTHYNAEDLVGVSCQRGERVRCLKKPLDVSGLYEAIYGLLSEQTSESPRREHPLAQRELTDVHILVVDDNLANLRVAKGMLKSLGCNPNLIETAGNGQEAMALFQEKAFDLVFMDCQMPIMDGYEATKGLRELESRLGREPSPVIAFTADVTKEAQQAWRRVGMDGYLSKPVALGALRDKLLQFTQSREQTPLPAAASTVDLSSALAGFGCSEEEFIPIAQVIMEDVPRLMKSLEQAIDTQDQDLARSISHTLKGSLINTLFPQLAPPTRELHEHIRAMAWSQSKAGIQRVHGVFSPIGEVLNDLVAGAEN